MAQTPSKKQDFTSLKPFSGVRKRNWYYHYSLAEQLKDVTISLQVTRHDKKIFKE